MSEKTLEADVIIAGGGPAGSVAAFVLASAGYRVTLLEKLKFPRYKVCGAGLTHKILQEIPFSITPVIETRIHTFRFSTHFSETFERTSPDPLIYCTMRDKLDNFMLSQAQGAGVKVLFGEQVTAVAPQGKMIKVVTRTGEYLCRRLIGAEGATGKVARSAGLWRDMVPGLAWEAELEIDAVALERIRQTVFLDWGSFPGGYGWLFPKSGHISVGVGGPAALSRHMMPYYRNFIDYLKDTGIQVNTTRSLRSWPIPVKVRSGKFRNGNVFITGDAAGLTDPLTGEGIYYAVRSGRIAAEEVIASFGKFLAHDHYSARINSELMPELLEAQNIKHLFNTVPLKIHRFVRDNDRAWRAFCKVLRGERNYADVRKGFGRYSPLWSVACLGARLISVIREFRLRKGGSSQ